MSNKDNRIAYKTYGFTSDDIEEYNKNTGRDFYKDWKDRKTHGEFNGLFFI